MAMLNISRVPTKRWVMDDEVTQCPICGINFEGHFLDIMVGSRTHCRFCGRVFCTTCCNKELYMPEHEVVRPPPSERIKNMGFDPTKKQKTCKACFKILKPQQELIKASRGQSRNLPGEFRPRMNPSPMYSITIIRAKGLQGKKGSVSIKSPVCLLTMGNTSSITQATQSGSDPVWDQSFDVPVKGEHGNSLKLTCYEEEMGEKRLIGEGLVKVVDTAADGIWVPITDKRCTVTGQVLVSCTFKAAPATWPVASVSGGTPATAMGVSTHSTYDAESDYGTERPIPFMHWLQEKAWLVYVGLLLISVFYRFAQSIGFSGDPIALKPGTPNGNDVTKRSDTHYIKMTS